jgi:anti-anti-sigma factor
MSIACNESDAEIQVVLEGTIDIGGAGELKAILSQALESGRGIRVLVANVAYMDVTAVQLLWAAEQQARRSDVDFQISGPLPEPVSIVLGDAGFPTLPASLNAG